MSVDPNGPCLGVPLSSAKQSLKLLGDNLGQTGISSLRVPDDLVAARLGITCFELAASHVARRRALLRKGLLSHDNRRIHLIIRLHLDDNVPVTCTYPAYWFATFMTM